MNSIKSLPALSAFVPILIFPVVVYFLLLPAFKDNISHRLQIKNRKIDLGVAQAPIKESGVLKEDIKGKKAQLTEMETRLFWKRDISKFLTELTRLAADLEIEFISLKPEPLTVDQESRSLDKKEPKELKKMASVPISVAFKSNYNDIINFLKRIEEGERFIRVDSLSIESESGDMRKHVTKMGLSIFVEAGG
ncbi:MAG: type 4a pilus biogenesis protein PilO [Candidatus Omnitrophota bacterium]